MIKNKLKGIAILLIAVLFSCENDNSSNQSSLSTEKSKAKLVSFTDLNSRSNSPHNMLSFENWQEFDSQAKQLDDAMDVYDDVFLATWSDLNEEELETKEEELNYTEQQPLIDFENEIGFQNTLRKKFNIKNDIFLNDEVLDPAKDPYSMFQFSEGELSLLNNKQQVMVAGQIYQFGVEGYILIKSNFAQNLAYADNNINQAVIPTEVEIVPTALAATDCKGWKSGYKEHNIISGQRFARLHSRIRSVPFYTKTKALSVSYKKKRRGWKESRIYMATGISDKTLTNADCKYVTGGFEPKNTYKNRKRRQNNLNFWGNDILRAVNGQSVVGEFRFYDGRQDYYILAW